MSSTYANILDTLAGESRRWVITGCAGFIGSHLLAKLLDCGQHVTGLDDCSSGKRANLDEVRAQVGEKSWERFRLIEGDIRESSDCREACREADFVLHQAAMVSVPLSLQEPLRCNSINVDGFQTVLEAARQAGVERVVYASSSAVYGDFPEMPLREDVILRPTSPYGASKLEGESRAQAFSEKHGIATVGLRYFNVFGPRQDPAGGYAAVIPRWIATALRGEPCRINGDGNNTRDFCHIANVIQANILAAMTPMRGSEAFNVGLGERTSLNELSSLIASHVARLNASAPVPVPIHDPARAGDIIHSQADVSKIRQRLGFAPTVNVVDGIAQLVQWNAECIHSSHS